MMSTIIGYMITCINAVFGWFDQLMDSLPGAFSFILAMIGAFTVFRLLIRPIMGAHIGGAGSDVARVLNKENKKDYSAFADFKKY